MDKVIRVIQGANGILTCGKKYSLNLTLYQKKKKRKGKKQRKEKGDKKKA